MTSTDLTFPLQLDHVRDSVLAQIETLRRVAFLFADALEHGGLVHVYANGHSRIAVEELVVRMGALTGFHPLLTPGLTTFTGVVGNDGIRINQTLEKLEGISPQFLAEFDIGVKDVLVVISATGTTTAAVDMALAWDRLYPDLPMVMIASRIQSDAAPAKHSLGKNLSHIADARANTYFLDNAMPMGDVTTLVESAHGTYPVCPLSTLGAVTLVQSLNELTIRELSRRGVQHHVLRNMHLSDTRNSYDDWLRDQRQRYAKALHNPERVEPKP
jgi:uncharacterized phosphosugar-binding protein